MFARGISWGGSREGCQLRGKEVYKKFEKSMTCISFNKRLGSELGHVHIVSGLRRVVSVITSSEGCHVVRVERDDLMINVLGRAVQIDVRTALEDWALEQHGVVELEVQVRDFSSRDQQQVSG